METAVFSIMRVFSLFSCSRLLRRKVSANKAADDNSLSWRLVAPLLHLIGYSRGSGYRSRCPLLRARLHSRRNPFGNPGSGDSHAPAAQKVRLAGAEPNDLPSLQIGRRTRRSRPRV